MKPLLARIACACTLAGCHAPVAPADAASAPDVAADSGGDVSAPADTTAVAALDVAPDADIAATPTAIPLTDLLHAYARRSCELRVACTPGMQRDETWLETCALQGTMVDGMHANDPLLGRIRLVELGRLQYNPSAAAACLAEANCASNAGTMLFTLAWLGGMHVPRPGATEPAACLDVFTGGTSAVGAACDDDKECASGRCWGCPGVCRATAMPGAPCGRDVPCADSEVCAKDTAGIQRCLPLAPIALGEACTAATCDTWNGTPCVACESGTWCDRVSGTCKQELPDGATCTEANACASGQTCVYANPNLAHCSKPLPDGALCIGYADCSRDQESPPCIFGSTLPRDNYSSHSATIRIPRHA